MSDPRFVRADLREVAESGVLLQANRRFFWPLGLALTWNVSDDGTVTDLHVRQWEWDDGHLETIELAADDPVEAQRREAFTAWADEREARMAPEPERVIFATAAVWKERK